MRIGRVRAVKPPVKIDGRCCGQRVQLGRDRAWDGLRRAQEHRPPGAAVGQAGQHILLELAAQADRGDRDPFIGRGAFIEAKYVNVFNKKEEGVDNSDLRYVPITVGIMF